MQDGPFWGCSRMERGAKRPPLIKISHAYPTMMKLGAVIPYLKKIQRIYKSRDTPLLASAFFHRKPSVFVIQERISNFYMVAILMISAKLATLGLLK